MMTQMRFHNGILVVVLADKHSGQIRANNQKKTPNGIYQSEARKEHRLAIPAHTFSG